MEEKMKREPVNKELRWRVFQRDKFRCQECGRTPPEVILDPDHIVPVSKGGKTEFSNLQTLCRECNEGKRDRPVLSPATIALQNLGGEQIEQLDAYINFLEQRDALKDRMLEYLNKKWKTLLQNEGFSEKTHCDIRRYLDFLSLEELSRGIEITAYRCRTRTINNPLQKEKYFWGVINSHIKRKKEHKV